MGFITRNSLTICAIDLVAWRPELIDIHPDVDLVWQSSSHTPPFKKGRHHISWSLLLRKRPAIEQAFGLVRAHPFAATVALGFGTTDGPQYRGWMLLRKEKALNGVWQIEVSGRVEELAESIGESAHDRWSLGYVTAAERFHKRGAFGRVKQARQVRLLDEFGPTEAQLPEWCRPMLTAQAAVGVDNTGALRERSAAE
jgi:hypothetical protein